MFDNFINDTSFTKNWGQLERVHLANKQFDNSLISTVRAVLLRRTDDDDIRVSEFKLNSPYWLSADVGFKEFHSACLPESRNNMYFIGVNMDDEVFRHIAEHIAELVPVASSVDTVEWRFVPRVQEFFSRDFGCFALVNDNLKSSVILANTNEEIKKWHAMQAAVLTLVPWYFNKEEGITDEERRLFTALTDGDAAEYAAALEDIFDKHYREKYLSDALDGFADRRLVNQLASVSLNIDQLQDRISEYHSMIAEYAAELREKQATALGLRMTLDASAAENDLLDYFKGCNNISLIAADKERNGGYVEFFAHDYLTYWDEDEAETSIRNKHSNIYSSAPRTRYVSKKDMRFLMTAIFVEKLLKVRIIARYSLDGNGHPRGFSYSEYPAEFADYLPNPHIQRYHCLGQYESTMERALIAGDFIPAVEQCIASVRSLNFGDDPVMCEFMPHMYNSTARFIALPDGTQASPAEAVAYLKSTGYIPSEEEDDQNEQAD